MTQKSDRKPTSLEGWRFFTIYRNQAVYSGGETTTHRYAAGDNEKVWVFDDSFEKIQAQLDEIHGPLP